MSVLVRFSELVLVAALCSLCDGALPKETYMTTPKKIAANGYPIQKHRVDTHDGYVLQMHRIPHGIGPAKSQWMIQNGIGPSKAKSVIQNDKGPAKSLGGRRRAVLLMHGLAGCSDNYVLMGPNRSLAYVLADAGYDVWMGNFRGNQYTSHNTLSRRDPQFWQYSLHEHGSTDLPAMIDHVLKVTGQRKLMYVGHSMGTTAFLIMLAAKPEYNDKVVSFGALTPAVYMDHLKPLVIALAKEIRLGDLLRARGLNYIALPPYIKDALINVVCTAKDPKEDICLRFIYRLIGEDYEQHDWSITPVLLASMQPVSVNELEHYAKIVYNSVFTTFEGGIWGPVKPYNLSNVRVPSLLIYGENDQLTRKDGVTRLAKELYSVNTLEDITPVCDCPKFNHFDFAIAKDLGSLITRPLVGIINRLYDKYYPDREICTRN